MPASYPLPGLLGLIVVTITTSSGCVDRVIVEEDPLGGFVSHEAMCREYCEIEVTCGTYYDWERCDLECNRPREKWPWLTDECIDLYGEMLVCRAGYDTCEEYDPRTREGDPCLNQQYNWEAAGYECFGQHMETDGWQGGSSSGP